MSTPQPLGTPEQQAAYEAEQRHLQREFQKRFDYTGVDPNIRHRQRNVIREAIARGHITPEAGAERLAELED